MEIRSRLHDQNSPRFLVAPPAPKTLEILETLAFLKGSKISEILEPLKSPQEALKRGIGKTRSRVVEIAASGRAVMLRYLASYRIYRDESR